MQLSSAFADDILCSSGEIGIRGRFKLCFLRVQLPAGVPFLKLTQGVPLGDYTKLEVEDSVNEFLRDAKDDAISNYVDPDVEPEDIIIHFDGTPKEFAKEFEMHVLVAMTSNFEHAFLDFSDINSISRSHFELAVAQFMSAYEREEGKVDNFCNDDKD